MPSAVPPGLFDQFARGWRAYALIALLALVSGLFGVARVPVTDIDEARFAQATRQMVESGDYVRIRFQDSDRNRKPVGIYWLQAASVQAMAPFTERLNTIWPYRLPSVLGLVLASIATLWAGIALFDSRTGFIGAALFSVGLLSGAEGMLAKTDGALVGFTTLALAAITQLRVGTARPRLVALLFWVAIACGILIKGPVTPLVAALTLVTLAIWERRAAWMRPLGFWPGPLLALALALPWLITIGVTTDWQFYTELLKNELGPKLAIGGDHRHGGLPGYYLLWLPVLIFPATYALPAALRLGWSAVRSPATDPEHSAFRFLVAWAAPTFVFFELMPAKLIHYTLPVYPAVALMCAAGLVAMRGRRWRTAHPAGIVLFGVVGALVIALMAVVSTYMPGYLADAGLRRAIATALIGALTLGGAITGLIMLRRATARAAVLVACALVFSFSLRERLLPEARTLFVSNEAAATMTRARLMPDEGERFWIVGYEQPSIVFLTRTSVRILEVEDVGNQIQAGDGIIIEGRVMSDVEAALRRNGLVFEAEEEPARGMAIGRGEYMTLNIGRVRDASGEAPADGPQ